MARQLASSCVGLLQHLRQHARQGLKLGSHESSLRGFAAAAGPPSGFIEVREYTIKPEGFKDFMTLSAQAGDLRKQLLPFLGMFTSDVGNCLHKVVHFYHYNDYDERDAKRAAALQNPAWQKFVSASRVHVQYQENKVMMEAAPVYGALSLPSAAHYTSPAAAEKKAMYEMRTYQLHPGYGSVPKLVEAFSKGLPEKVAADTEGQLVLFAATDVGMLNNVIELWRYPSAQACIRARQAARKVPIWRETINSVTPGVQHFNSSFMYPVPFSPWQ